MLTRIVKLTFQENYINDFLKMYEQKSSKIMAAEGCKSVTLLRDKLNPNIFFTYSIWLDEVALENYRQSNLFMEVWNTIKPNFAAKAEAWSTSTI